MHTINSYYRFIVDELTSLYDKREAHSIAGMLLEHVLKCDRTAIMVRANEPLTDEIIKTFQEYLNKLKSSKPIQYVLGETEFCGLKMKVNEHVLIPRPETELLVNWIVSDPMKNNQQILDVGCGSGCIAIALKHKMNKAEVHALDVSEQALVVARQNAALNKLDIHFIHADILTLSELNQKFNVIVSNPPYVPESDISTLNKNVKDFEPKDALFVKDDDALIFYDRIAEFGLRHLQNPGKLFFEIYEKFAGAIVEMLSDKGFQKIEVRKDLANKDRMIKAELI